MKRTLLLGVALGIVTPVFAEEVSVTPYRPTVTNSAGLSAPGWLELETGFVTQDNKDGSKQQALLYLTKLAFTPDFGVLIGGMLTHRKRMRAAAVYPVWAIPLFSLSIVSS